MGNKSVGNKTLCKQERQTYSIDESKTAKNTQYFESVLNSYENFRKLPGDLTYMQNRPTLFKAKQSKAKQSKAKQSKAQHGLTVLFLRHAVERCLELDAMMQGSKLSTGCFCCTLIRDERICSVKQIMKVENRHKESVAL